MYRSTPISFASLLLLFLFLSIASTSQAESLDISEHSDSAYDLINAVNALRLSNGLPAYGISSILMYTAQSQADFMAASGLVTHSGPGGIGVTDRLLAAGYPLAGDLSLGGFRSENIISGSEDMSAAAAVDAWTGDAPHLNTMLASSLTEIGAGVALANGKVYYVIDAALPKGGGYVSVVTQSVGGSAIPASEAPVSSVMVSTPNPSGDIIHEVKYGQTLWQIAISYGVKIDDIKHLNNLSGNDIYPGEKLLVKKETAGVTETPLQIVANVIVETATATLTPVAAITLVSPTSTPAIFVESVPAAGKIAGWMIGILALALLGGGIFAWRGGRSSNN